ncbi:MAG: MopE-related protein [Chitinophagales bacterium]
MKNTYNLFLLISVITISVNSFARTVSPFLLVLPDSTNSAEDSLNAIIQDIDADTLRFDNEIEFRDFLRHYGLKNYTVLPPQIINDCTYNPPVSIYPVQVNDDFLNEWRFEGLPFILIFDHIATRKVFNLFLPRLNDPNVNVCNVNMWLTHPVTGQVAQFNDVFNWQDENGKNIFSVNKKVSFLWQIESGVWSFPIDFVQDSTGYDFTFEAYYPGHDDADLSFNGIEMYNQVIRYKDLDGDGYGNPGLSELAYSFTPGYSDNNEDCNDSTNSINPGTAEICNNIDDNCDGSVDNDLPEYYLYADQDGDGFTGDVILQTSCLPFTVTTANNTDCNDTTNTINPSAIEICNQLDDNCSGEMDEGLPMYNYYADLDNDLSGDNQNVIYACNSQVGYVSDNTDCNDSNATINTAGTEICNNIDDNCNGLSDETFTFYTFYNDADADGFGSLVDSISYCDNVQGYITDKSDCNDFDANINPTSTEICNNVDDNCNGLADEDVQTIFYADADGDNFGNPGNTIFSCSAPVGFVTNNADCNDAEATINATSAEVCNAIDDDCDGFTDDEDTNVTNKPTWYADTDNDNFGDLLSTVNLCSMPAGYVSDSTDCNDKDSKINPAEAELCNALDDNCNGFTDEDLQTLFYADADGDGFGDITNSVYACEATEGFVSDYTDCNDSVSAINISRTEICNTIDDDCNGFTDEDVQTLFYADADGDGFGDITNSVYACEATEGFVPDNTDCNDTFESINSARSEICNNVDDNCNGLTDEDVQTIFYADVDGDNFGNALQIILACEAPEGYVSDNTDCNDSDAIINSTIVETCNNTDDDCDGLTDNGLLFLNYYFDADSDGYGSITEVATIACNSIPGYVANNTDCNDENASIHPSSVEICNDLDDDCNGEIDNELAFNTYYADTDNDGFGNQASSIYTCTIPAGYVIDQSDCDNNAAYVNPSVSEVCNGIDDDCNGIIDYGTDFASLTVSGPTAVCIGTSVTLSASEESGYIYKWYRNEKFSFETTSSTYTTTQKGTYKVEIITADGCSDFSNNMVITNIALPSNSISVSTGTDLCTTSFVRMKVTFSNGNTYQWYNNETAILGATSYKYEATVTGNYYCKLTNSSGCTTNSNSVVVTNSCRLTIETGNSEFSVKAFPNPANDFFNIEVTLSMPSDMAWVHLYSINGSEVLRTALEVDNYEGYGLIQLPSNIEPGLYGLRVTTTDEEKTIMLMVN